MNKKEKKIISGISLILIFGMFLISSNGFYFPFASGDFINGVSDLSILSISQVTLNGEPAIRIYATANGGAEVLDIDWGTSEINSKLREGGSDLIATESIRGGIQVGRQTLEFPYASTGETIHRSVKQISIGTFVSCNYENCKNSAGSGDVLDWMRPGLSCQCLIGLEKADVGKWSSITKGNYPVTFYIDGLGSTTFDRDSMTKYLNDETLGNNAKIQFEGFLDSYDSVGEPSYTPYLYLNQIQLLEPTSFALITSAKRNLLDSFGYWDVNTYNSILNDIFIDKYSQYSRESYIYSSSRDVSGIKITLDKPISYPTFTITLNAESVGIIEQSGQPDNLYCEDTKFKANELGETTCSVRNSGGAGSFSVDLTNCGTSAFVIGGNNLGGFDVGEEDTFKINLQGTTDNENGEEGNCRVKVYDLNDPSKYDTFTFGYFIEYNPGGKCSPIGKLICDEQLKNILECKSSGTYELKESCDEICSYGTNGVAFCSIEDEDGCKWYDLGCYFLKFFGSIKNVFSDLFSGVFSIFKFLKYAIVFVASLLSMFLTNDFSKSIKTLKQNKWLRITFSIIIGLFISIFLYLFIGSFLFWVFGIALIVFIFLIKMVKPI